MNAFVSDFLYAFRIFFKRPGLTILAILALAVSLGMSTTTFSTLNGMFFKPLPFKEPQNLHHIFLRNTQAEMKMMPVPSGQLESLRQIEAFEDVMGYYSGTINISGDGRPRRYTGAFVSANFLELLGRSPVLGRTFSEAATQADGPREILISHDMWRDRFREDPDILGSPIRANGEEHRIVGVLPGGFNFPNEAHAWVPLNRALFPGSQGEAMHIVAVGRMADGVSGAAARSQLEDLYRSWEAPQLENREHLLLSCEPFGRLEMNRASQSLIVVTISAVIFILLVSCANVANLLVGRALTRGREMAIRSALGATRRRIIRQLLTESLVLSFFGAIGGLLYAAWAVDAATKSRILDLPYWMSIELDWRVFLFVLAVMLVTALVSGLVPAWQASKTDLNEMLKDTAHTSTSFRLGRLTRTLAVIQIAFSCALLFGAGLVARNTVEMNRIEPGFDPEEILTMRMGLFPHDYPDEADRDRFYNRLVQKVDAVPGVRKSAVTSWIGQYGNFEEPFIIADERNPRPEVAYAYIESVSPGYFETFSMKAGRGRLFTARDARDTERVVVVNAVFANRYFGKANPVGRRISFIMDPGAARSESWKIVGVASDVRVSNFTRPDKEEPIIYTPHAQADSPFMSLVINTNSPESDEGLLEAVQQVILSLDPHLPVYFTKTMSDFIGEQIYPFRVLANFFLSIGLMALFLAAIGVYGMLAFNVSRRRREIGIRMALGANTRTIVSQVLRQGFVQVVLGILVGTGLAYLVGQMTRNFLIGINPADPSVYMGVLLILVGVAALAFFLPARRAARLSPMDALRYE